MFVNMSDRYFLELSDVSHKRIPPVFLFASFIVPYFILFTKWFNKAHNKSVSILIQDRVEDLIADLSEKELKIFADEKNLNLEDHDSIHVFIQSLSEEEAEVIIKELELRKIE